MNTFSAIALALFALSAPPKPTFDVELGSGTYTQMPKTWEVDVPKGTKRVEMIFFRKPDAGEKEYAALPGREGIIKVNGTEVVKWLRKEGDGVDVYQNCLTKAEIRSTDKTAEGLWIDVSAAMKVGKNEVHYYFRASGERGVRVRGWRK